MFINSKNLLCGQISHIKSDVEMTEIIINIGGREISSSITTDSQNRLNLKTGDSIYAFFNASNVIITK
jgi:molybdopterin-binding protein